MSKREEKAVASDDAPVPAEPSVQEQDRETETAAADGETGQDRADPGERIAALEEEIASLKDQVLRRAADLENFRKRMAREREDAVAYANQMLLLDLLPMIDDFERAVASAESSRDFDALHDGVELIERQLTAMLEKKWGLVRFASVGQQFDAHRHHAIAMDDSADVEAVTVVDEYQKGYMFRHRVLRPATVKVVQPRPRGTGGQDSMENKET